MHHWKQQHDFNLLKRQCPELQGIRGNATNYCHSDLNSEVTIVKHDPDSIKEEPISTEDRPFYSQTSLNTSQDPSAFEKQSMPPVYCPLNPEMRTTLSHSNLESHSSKDLSIARVDEPLSNEMGSSASHKEIDQLLSLAAEGLRRRLRTNWICLTEGDGIHALQLSRNFEKSVQRRLYFSRRGDVHLSVHCVPIPISNFVPCLTMVKLEDQRNLSKFVTAMEAIVNVVRELEICTGVCHDKYKALWESSKKGEVDKNPYQEARYSVSLRSIQCLRLVRPRQRMCVSCNKLNESLRLKARSIAKKLGTHPHHPSCGSYLKCCRI